MALPTIAPSFMHKATAKYRVLIASLLCVWMSVIIISGVVFMHKEVTSTGEIVTHVHPYDFTNKNKSKQHHHSDEEIQFLNIIFHGNYLAADAWLYELPLAPILYALAPTLEICIFSGQTPRYYALRGPPIVVT